MDRHGLGPRSTRDDTDVVTHGNHLCFFNTDFKYPILTHFPRSQFQCFEIVDRILPLLPSQQVYDEYYAKPTILRFWTRLSNTMLLGYFKLLAPNFHHKLLLVNLAHGIPRDTFHNLHFLRNLVVDQHLL